MTIHIGNKIKELVQDAHITNREFARLLGMTENNVYKIFNKSNIDTELLYKICNILDVPIIDFFKTSEEQDKVYSKEEFSFQLHFYLMFKSKVIKIYESLIEQDKRMSKGESIIQEKHDLTSFMRAIENHDFNTLKSYLTDVTDEQANSIIESWRNNSEDFNFLKFDMVSMFIIMSYIQNELEILYKNDNRNEIINTLLKDSNLKSKLLEDCIAERELLKNKAVKGS